MRGPKMIEILTAIIDNEIFFRWRIPEALPEEDPQCQGLSLHRVAHVLGRNVYLATSIPGTRETISCFVT
jgi:hypothetical protein